MMVDGSRARLLWEEDENERTNKQTEQGRQKGFFSSEDANDGLFFVGTPNSTELKAHAHPPKPAVATTTIQLALTPIYFCFRSSVNVCVAAHQLLWLSKGSFWSQWPDPLVNKYFQNVVVNTVWRLVLAVRVVKKHEARVFSIQIKTM